MGVSEDKKERNYVFYQYFISTKSENVIWGSQNNEEITSTLKKSRT